MYNESTTIVDAVATTDGYALSIKAGDLYIAYEVVRRHVDEDGARHFAQLTESKLTEDGYAFTFDTGDVFTCAAADEYPASETLSDDSSGGGSGGGVLVVTDTDGTLDKTWQEIHDSDFVVLKYPDGSIQVTTGSGEDDGEYLVGFFTYGASPTTYVAQTASGYPSMEEGH